MENRAQQVVSYARKHFLKHHKTKKWKATRKRYYQENKKQFCYVVKNAFIKRRYGITLKEQRRLLKTRCEICGRTPKQIRLAIDHIVEGKMRGVLCINCNLVLGLIYNKIRLLQRAIQYLERRR